ncbi:MAG: hypothetical protein LBN93_08475 [Candidatus Symbiothrix sp.]|jgi:hypothetical protein|nr:hypothetical protein [Candidatus Symbiothrix sp.]
MLEVIDISQSERWDEIVRSMHAYDFYHLPAYHRLDTSGQPLLLYCKTNTDAFVLPIILRDIPGTTYKDITSVYGYAGPLSQTNNPSASDIGLFQEDLKVYFDVHHIVSMFTRLHPLFENQAHLLTGLGETVDLNQTVAIDLTQPEAKQRKQYAHSLKNDINRLKNSLSIKEAKSKEDIDAFIDIYYDNMKRVNASEKYFFSNDYFYQFFETINSTLLLAIYQGELISGSLFTECHGIVQSHLSATRSEYLYLSPVKYIWECIRRLAQAKNDTIFHLGGGFGGKDDSLFAFKSQFSKCRFMFQTGRYIHNQAVYAHLVAEKFKNEVPQSSYFPLYRLPLLSD